MLRGFRYYDMYRGIFLFLLIGSLTGIFKIEILEAYDPRLALIGLCIILYFAFKAFVEIRVYLKSR